jgi:thiamine-monophosphate kinase
MARSFQSRVLARESLSEGDAVELFKQRFAAVDPELYTGIGDDAAVLGAGDAPWVCSVDTSVEGVHFAYEYLSLEDVGYRAFQAALSDLAAMGARPRAALSSLILPRDFGRSKLARLSLGQAESARAGGCPVVGGNVSRGGELSVTTTVLGQAERPLLRSGARAGQELWLIGAVGCAAAGLASLRGGGPHARSSDIAVAFERCVAAWRRPRALIEQGLALVEHASAAIDVSDGLAADAGRVARASGVSIQIDRGRLRAALSADLIAVGRALRRAPLHFALYGGEDYALLATGERRHRPSFARAIGHVSHGHGVWLVQSGVRQPLIGGYDHLRRDA